MIVNEDEVAEIAAAARQLPWRAPSPEVAAVLERRLLASLPRRSFNLRVAAAAAVALLAAGGAGALAGRLTAPAPGPTRVELAGTQLQVAAGSDVEIEASEDRLQRVSVRSGGVEVRHSGAAVVLLGAGEEWRARAPEVVSLERTVPPPALPRVEEPLAVPRRAPVPAIAPAPLVAEAEVEEPEVAPAPEVTDGPAPDPAAAAGEHAFAAGWDALRAGNDGRAADRFAGAVDADPHGALAEDARYWRVVALQRAGLLDAAATDAAAFLRLHPGSKRAGEIQVLLGADALRRGDRAGAAERFRAALGDATPEVRTRAREGLRAAGP